MIWNYLFIFVAKLVEVSLTTVRNMLVNRGERTKAAVIGFFEVLIWIIVVGDVLKNVTEDPVKVLVYCFAYALGNYLGVTIEGKLAIGLACVQAVVGCEQTEVLSAMLREQGFGVTILDGEGKNGPVNVLMIYSKRKCVPEAVALIREHTTSAPITINDVRQMRNGFLKVK